MFNDIFNTAIRFSVILMVFIVAFGLGFHLIFINQVRTDIKKGKIVFYTFTVGF